MPRGLHIEGPPYKRFWARVLIADGCWEWGGPRSDTGYGKFSISQRLHAKAHRWAWEWMNGPVPDGLSLDHLCRNRGCVNPWHMEPVTHAENVRRGRSGRFHGDKTHCPQGHAYDEANTYIVKVTGARQCRTCRNSRKYRRNHALAH
jgi:hypothetical protein